MMPFGTWLPLLTRVENVVRCGLCCSCCVLNILIHVRGSCQLCGNGRGLVKSLCISGNFQFLLSALGKTGLAPEAYLPVYILSSVPISGHLRHSNSFWASQNWPKPPSFYLRAEELWASTQILGHYTMCGPRTLPDM